MDYEVRTAQTSIDGEIIPSMSVMDIVSLVKKKLGNVVVFVQCGYFWEVYNEDAVICSEI